MSDILDAPAPAVERRRLTGRGRVAVIGGVVLVLLCGLGWAGWWWTHPTLFGAPGNAVGTDQVTVGTHVNVGISFPGDADTSAVTIESIEPNVAENTSASTITLSVCTVDPATGPVGLLYGDPRDLCLAVRPVTDVRLAPDEYILMTVTPSRPGVTDVPDFDYTYRYGWHRLLQHGTQTTGVHVTVTTP